jgi:hypothetical protein
MIAANDVRIARKSGQIVWAALQVSLPETGEVVRVPLAASVTGDAIPDDRDEFREETIIRIRYRPDEPATGGGDGPAGASP